MILKSQVILIVQVIFWFIVPQVQVQVTDQDLKWKVLIYQSFLAIGNISKCIMTRCITASCISGWIWFGQLNHIQISQTRLLKLFVNHAQAQRSIVRKKNNALVYLKALFQRSSDLITYILDAVDKMSVDWNSTTLLPKLPMVQVHKILKLLYNKYRSISYLDWICLDDYKETIFMEESDHPDVLYKQAAKIDGKYK